VPTEENRAVLLDVRLGLERLLYKMIDVPQSTRSENNKFTINTYVQHMTGVPTLKVPETGALALCIARLPFGFYTTALCPRTISGQLTVIIEDIAKKWLRISPLIDLANIGFRGDQRPAT
jgi:hypothetical protein